MLVELRVENLGIISQLDLIVGRGLTAITGETGAGKTLIVEALELLLGGRADATLVRSGAQEARAEARFVVGDREIVLARVLPQNGRSRAYIDGRMATAAELGELGRSLVDLHGQHDQQSLLFSAEQRSLLDSYAGSAATDALDAVRAARRAVSAIDAELASLGGDERSRAREIDLLQFQTSEIVAAEIVEVGEEATITESIDRLADAEAHQEALDDAYRLLDTGIDAVGAAVAGLDGRGPLDELVQRLRGAQADLAEIGHDVRIARENMIANPEQLEVLSARRQLLRELRRKYGESLADVVAFLVEAQDRLAALESHADRVASLTHERVERLGAAHAAAKELSDIRRRAVVPLSAAVTEQLQTLALVGATFSIELTQGELTDDGLDTVSFELAPNPGEPARPLARAASGGELSRTMLAIRVVLSQAPPTLIFDEVDAGIGGEVGIAIGRALKQLGEHHQVLVVTHLAQVASAADAQVHVSKTEHDGRTVSRAELLLDGARVHELSRMLGGSRASESARAHAQELLATANATIKPRKKVQSKVQSTAASKTASQASAEPDSTSKAARE